MANPFYVEPANALQALMMGQQGYQTGREFSRDNAIAQAGKLYAAGDVNGAKALAAQGGPSGLALLMNMTQQGNTDRAFGLQQQQFEEQKKNTAFSQNLQTKQSEEKPQYMKDDQGNIVEISPYGKGARVIQPTGAPAPSNPFLAGGNMNEAQSKDALYANRMMNAERTFRDPKVIEAGMSVAQRGLNAIPGVGNFLVNDQYQKYDQAQRDFINATLRRESGAVISPAEFDNAAKQYFPRPGDSPEVLKQKQQNRVEAIKGIGAGGGKNYKPAYNFDQAGNIVERGTTQQAAPKATPPQQAIAALRSNPALRDQFDAKYGAGASAQALGQ